jgi:hypothetical protein
MTQGNSRVTHRKGFDLDIEHSNSPWDFSVVPSVAVCGWCPGSQFIGREGLSGSAPESRGEVTDDCGGDEEQEVGVEDQV